MVCAKRKISYSGTGMLHNILRYKQRPTEVSVSAKNAGFGRSCGCLLYTSRTRSFAVYKCTQLHIYISLSLSLSVMYPLLLSRLPSTTLRPTLCNIGLHVKKNIYFTCGQYACLLVCDTLSTFCTLLRYIQSQFRMDCLSLTFIVQKRICQFFKNIFPVHPAGLTRNFGNISLQFIKTNIVNWDVCRLSYLPLY